MSPALAAIVLAQVPAPFPAATSTSICGAKTIPYQQSALAAGNGALWVGCRDARKLIRLTSAGRAVRTVRLGAFRPWAVAAGGGALWVVSREVPQLLEISRGGRVLRRIPLLEPAASLWYGAGSVWLGFEGFGFERVDPKTGRATTFAEGNGVSAFAADGAAVYAVSHRDNTITRISLATGRSRTVTSGLVDPSTGSAEAAAFAGGSLWVTGRGLDLLRVSTSTGKVRAVTDIGPAGFVVSVTSGRIVVAGYSDLGARRGDPIVGSFSTVDPRSGNVVARTAATGTAYLSGFSTAAGTIFAADTVQGRLVRLAVPG